MGLEIRLLLITVIVVRLPPLASLCSENRHNFSTEREVISMTTDIQEKCWLLH